MAGIEIRLLGSPFLVRTGGQGRQPRGRKAWGMLAHLLLHPPVLRSQMASLLFPDAVDPLGTLRWHLSDLRRVLGPAASLGGDPAVLRLPPGCIVDTADVRIAALPVLDAELLRGLDYTDQPSFDAWLTMERHRFRHEVETLVYDGGLAALAEGDLATAVSLGARAVDLDPLNADFQALLVRAHLAAGDRAAARSAAARCRKLFTDHLGTGLPAEVQQALAAPPSTIGTLPATPVAVRSFLEAAEACVSAGAITTALAHLRVANDVADRLGDRPLQAEAAMALAGALIHGAGGRGAEVADLLHGVLAITRDGDPAIRSAAYRELGFLAVQRGFPASGTRWLTQAVTSANGLPEERARALGVVGMLATDTADYPAALVALRESVRLSVERLMPRQEAFARAMLGRLHLLTGAHTRAFTELEAAAVLITAQHWTSFVAFVDALRSEVHCLIGHEDIAEDYADHATALATTSGDRCFLDAATHAKAQVLLVRGDTVAANVWICRGLAPDPWYRWFRGRNLDLACMVTLRVDPSRARRLAEELGELSSRYGHHELTVRAYSARAELGDLDVIPTLTLLARRIENPLLAAELASRHFVASGVGPTRARGPSHAPAHGAAGD